MQFSILTVSLLDGGFLLWGFFWVCFFFSKDDETVEQVSGFLPHPWKYSRSGWTGSEQPDWVEDVPIH